MTGESIPVRKRVDSAVYAGTVIEEGKITLSVKEASGTTRYEKIIKMIEDSEKLKSDVEDRTSHLKGGKYLEAFAEADVIVFDKTSTLTKAEPTARDIISFGEKEANECLRIAACLEEHFPHSMARAVVTSAEKNNLEHEEMHSKVEYIVAHGIASSINQKRVVIGSYHFIFEDEMCKVPEEKQHILILFL